MFDIEFRPIIKFNFYCCGQSADFWVLNHHNTKVEEIQNPAVDWKSNINYKPKGENNIKTFYANILACGFM